jgi:Transcriptional regulator containing an amidase domain and an AraC-type DNA-binding HTH domain
MQKGLEVFSDASERINYNIPDYPLYVRKGTLRQFPRYSAECHWHSDLEFISVLNGSMEYYVNGQIVQIDAGCGIFVNSKRLHYGFSTEHKDCSYIVVAIHPSLLGEFTSPGTIFVKEKFGFETEDFILLSSEFSWQEEILLSMNKLFNEYNKNIPNILRLLSEAASMCANIAENIKKYPSRRSDDQTWNIFWEMIEYIHHSYANNVSLDSIAESGLVSRSRCCKLFSKYIGKSPNRYLNEYRITKSCEMLQETNRSIYEISFACGFQTASYFSYVFRQTMEETPQEYRKKVKESPNKVERESTLKDIPLRPRK